MSDSELTAQAKSLKFESNISIQINPVNSGHDVLIWRKFLDFFFFFKDVLVG